MQAVPLASGPGMFGMPNTIFLDFVKMLLVVDSNAAQSCRHRRASTLNSGSLMILEGS